MLTTGPGYRPTKGYSLTAFAQYGAVRWLFLWWCCSLQARTTRSLPIRLLINVQFIISVLKRPLH